MTTDTLILRVRRWLADTGRGYSSSRRFFENSEITDALTVKREELLLMLRKRPQEAATLTICRSVAVINGTEGQPIPDDLFMLECGLRSSSNPNNDPGGYIPVRDVSLGEQMVGMDGIYADGALFHGTAVEAVYYKKPTTDLTTVGLNLTDFPDAFYNTLATMAAISLIHKRSESFAKSRTPEGSYKSQRLQQFFQQQVSTLK